MKKILSMLLIAGLGISIFSCSENCNNCKELTTKRLVYLDANANNLFFGDSAIYNPDSVYIQTNDNAPILANQDPSQGAIILTLNMGATDYKVLLTNSLSDTLVFTLSEQKSERCCGSRLLTTSTQLNSEEISNNDLITIVK